MKLTLLARVITGEGEYVRICKPGEEKRTFRQICTKTLKQFLSHEYMRSKGFIWVGYARTT